MFYFSNHHEILATSTLYVEKKLAKFEDNIIYIDGVMTSQIILHDDKIWWHHISIKIV